MKKLIFIFLIALLFLFLSLHGFLRQQKLTPQEKHEVEVRLVLVDVIVTKGGEFVTDLTKEDFELYEDGVKVPINSMDLISLEKGEFITPEKPEIEIPALSQREKRMVVIFDSINTISRELERSKPKIIEKLISLFKLGREIMVLELTEKEGMEMLQPFTRDPELLTKAVKKASGSIWVEKSTDSLGKTPAIKDEAVSGQAQVKRDQAGRLLEMEFLASGYFSRIRFEKTINGLLALMNTIKDYPGRKTILLVSGGIPYSPVGYLGGGSDLQKIFDPFNLLNKPGARRKYEILDALIHFANSQNFTFYALDPDTYIKYLAEDTFAGPFRTRRKLGELHNLHWLAEATGGEHLKGAKRFENFYRVVKRDLSYHYELSFYPRRKQADGEFHEIQVKVKRSGMKVRFRKGYSDYSKDQKEVLLIASASYNPSLFKQIPFKAEAIPFVQSKDKFIMWMSLALPVKKIIPKYIEMNSSKNLILNILIRNPKEERAYNGQINIPINMTPSFLNNIKNIEFLGYSYRTPELKLKEENYKIVFALFDSQSNEVGTWESPLFLPKFKEKKHGAIINCVVGSVTSSREKRTEAFSISARDGSLEYGELKFLPSVTNQFHRGQDASVFLQIFIPIRRTEISPRFEISAEGRITQRIPSTLIAESWNQKTQVWSGMFNLNLRAVIYGNYTLKVKIPYSEGVPDLSKDVKLIKLRY